MAPSTKAAGGNSAANSSTRNGVISDTSAPGGPANSKKKQKRKKQQAARQAESQESRPLTSDQTLNDSHVANGGSLHSLDTRNPALHALPSSFDENASGHMDPDHYDHTEDADFAYSDEEGHYPDDTSLRRNGAHAAGNAPKRKGKKKKRSGAADQAYDHGGDPSLHYSPSAFGNPPPPPPPLPPPAPNDGQGSSAKSQAPIWNTSTQEERHRIKEFWLSLGEEERKSLVKIEKEAVLKKMKEQQKHHCSCTVCGRKRTAIEEELEVLYDAYYDELEQFANNQQGSLDARSDWKASPARFHMPNDREPPDRPPPLGNQHRMPRGRIQELSDEDDEDFDADDLDEAEYSEDYDENEYSNDEAGAPRGEESPDFFNFGNSLTVKGGILTVADDLLKNDGKKFIDMMEQLAERRMQRENEAQFPPYGMHSSIPPSHGYSPNHGLADDDYEDEDDEEYDSEDAEFEEDDEMDSMTEAQRMEEGRRMFQIFAARMFEQRVLTAYREKVARERQDQLIRELEEDSLKDAERDAKKAREAEKKKQKKQQQKQAKAEEKARKEEQKAQQEAAARKAEEEKQEEQKRKREEARKKKEAEKKAQEEEKQRKEAERLKRQQEERERQQETERKAREQKADEKKRKEEAKRKEREEREAKEKEAKERREKEDKAKREEEDRAKAESQAIERKRQEEQATQAAEASKRTALPTMVALPPGLKPRQQSGASPSPQAKVATPVLPKAPTPTPARVPQASTPASQVSPPQTPLFVPRSRQSTSPMAPPGSQSVASSVPPSRTPSHPLPSSQGPPMSGHQSVSAPGIPAEVSGAFAGPPSAINGFPGIQGQMNPMMGRQMVPQPGSMYQQYGSQAPPQQRAFMQPQAIGPQHGMNAPNTMGFGRGYTPELAPGFQYPPPNSGPNNNPQAFSTSREPMPSHSRQHSIQFDHSQSIAPDAAPAQPIARPAPIKRPWSPKQTDSHHDADVDEMTTRFGSKALLADDDDIVEAPVPLPGLGLDDRRPSGAPSLPSHINTALASPFYDGSQSTFSPGARGFSNSSWQSPPFATPSVTSPSSGWGAPQTPAGSGWSSASLRPIQRVRNGLPISVHARLATVLACKTLNPPGVSEEYHNINDVLAHANHARATDQGIMSMKDVLDIIDTVGNSANGGGRFVAQRDNRGLLWVKWEGDQGNAGSATRGGLGLGEIGSPRDMPPLTGLGAPF